MGVDVREISDLLDLPAGNVDELVEYTSKEYGKVAARIIRRYIEHNGDIRAALQGLTIRIPKSLRRRAILGALGKGGL